MPVPGGGTDGIILFGMGRYGSGIEQALRAHGRRIITIDYNPDLVRKGDNMGYPVLFGDAEDSEFVTSPPLAEVRWVVSTARERHVNQVLINSLSNVGYAGRIAVTAHGPADVARLEQAGADLVMMPFVDAAREAVNRILGQASRGA
jgi:Trk K+ transport system NAD-binding subunit